jgi:hypothetical protein
MFGVFCPECGFSKGVIIGVEGIGNKREYTFFCSNCDTDWPEEISFPNGDESRNMEIDSILLGFEVFDVAAECSLVIEHSLEEDVPVSKSGEEKCIESLKCLQSLLAKAENGWGLPRLKEVVVRYEKNVEWGIEAINDLFQSSDGRIKKEAGKIVRYFEAVKR